MTGCAARRIGMNIAKNAMIAFAAFLAGVGTVSAEERFEAGFARVDITPPIGTPLSGY